MMGERNETPDTSPRSNRRRFGGLHFVSLRRLHSGARPVIQTTADYLRRNNNGALLRNRSVVLDNGEVCTGPWELASKTPPATAATPIDLTAEWDNLYGPGYFAAHVLGNKLYARATLTGNKVARGIQQRKQYPRQHQGRRRGQQGQCFQSERL
jgi:hypothetical protein